MFNSYVELPEGNLWVNSGFRMVNDGLIVVNRRLVLVEFIQDMVLDRGTW